MIKAYNKLGIEGNSSYRFHSDKGNLQKSPQLTSYLIVKDWILSPKGEGQDEDVSALTNSVERCTGGLAREIKKEEEIKGNQIEKKEVKQFLFADDMILYRKFYRIHVHKKQIKTNNWIQQGCRY